MDFKSLLSQLDQLNEATDRSKSGKVTHTAEPGGYGRKDDEDDEGKKVKADAPKKGRGRPKKDADSSGEVKKYDASALSAAMGGGKKPSKEVGKVSKKHSLKEYFDQLDQALLEGETIEKKGGRVHKGTYGTSHEAGDEGVKKAPTQRGRGRPKKDADETGEVKKYDFSAFGAKKGVKLPAWDKNKTTKHSLKEDTTIPESQLYYALSKFLEAGESGVYRSEWQPADAMEVKKVINLLKQGDVEAAILRIEDEWPFMDSGALDELFDNWATKKSKQPFNVWKMIDKVKAQHNMDLDEAEQIEIKPASQMTKKPGQTSMPGQQQGQQTQNTQVIAQGNKTLGTVNNPQLAQQIKQSIGKGEMTLMPGDEMNEEDIGKHNNATTGFAAMVRKLTPKYGAEAAKRIAGAQLKKIREADMPPNDSLSSPLSLEEAKKPDANKNGIPDYAEDGKGKNDLKKKKVEEAMNSESKTDKKKCPPMSHIKKMCQDGKSVAEICKMHPDCDQKELKQMIADCKKKMVKEGMDHRLKAARHMGKAHALTKEGYNCRYDDMEESRHYHEGYKEGLDECYGQMPVQGLVVGETGMPPATVPGMASQAMEDDVMEVGRGDYMKQQAIKTPGNTFKAFGQTFRDKEVVESPFAFEAWDKELNALLEGKVDEGMTVSISKGQQGSPDSVSVTAQDGEADQLLQVIKQAGLGLFGGDDAGQPGQSSSMSLQPADGGQEGGEMEIDVVDDHDGMMNLIRKVTGAQPAPATQGFSGDEGSSDYEDEEGSDEHDHKNEETCNECGGMMEAGHSCGEGQEMVDEVESEDQMEYEVAEEIDPNNSDEENEVNSDAVRDAALAKASDNNEEQVDEDEAEAEAEDTEQKLDEWANDAGKNGTDTTFEQDIDFMTKVISGGLNKQKSTGQSTIPVVSSQLNRLGNPMKESVDLLHDWKKLSGIK
jgi:hypothetical protein